VGEAFTASSSAPLAERWTGHRWRLQRTPAPSGFSHAQLRSVSCTTASDCWAVGGTYSPADDVLIEHWNGTAWTLVAG
jgi:hypothetical protein